MEHHVELEVRKKRSPVLWLYLIFGLLIITIISWTSLRLLKDAPNREATVDLPGLGWVTVQFSTNPNPPLPTGIVTLRFMPTDSRNRMLDLGSSIPFSFGVLGSDTPVGSGQAAPDSTGMYYQAGVQFPMVGDYWLVLDLGAGKQVRYQLYVKPAQ